MQHLCSARRNVEIICVSHPPLHNAMRTRINPTNPYPLGRDGAVSSNNIALHLPVESKTAAKAVSLVVPHERIEPLLRELMAALRVPSHGYDRHWRQRYVGWEVKRDLHCCGCTCRGIGGACCLCLCCCCCWRYCAFCSYTGGARAVAREESCILLGFLLKTCGLTITLMENCNESACT